MDKQKMKKILINKKTKLNYIDGKYWAIPSIFSLSRGGWVSIPFNSLRELIDINNLLFEEVIININGDKDFIHFNELLKLRDIEFELSTYIMKNKDFLILELENIRIIFDSKSIIAIRKGIIPFYSLTYLNNLNNKKNLNNNKKEFFWRSSGLVEKTE